MSKYYVSLPDYEPSDAQIKHFPNGEGYYELSPAQVVAAITDIGPASIYRETKWVKTGTVKKPAWVEVTIYYDRKLGKNVTIETSREGSEINVGAHQPTGAMVLSFIDD